MPSLRRKPKGTWYVDYITGGRRIRQSLRTRDEAVAQREFDRWKVRFEQERQAEIASASQVSEGPGPIYNDHHAVLFRDVQSSGARVSPHTALGETAVQGEPLWKVLARLGQSGLEMGQRLLEIEDQKEAVDEERAAIDRERDNIFRRIEEFEVSRRMKEAPRPDVPPPKQDPKPEM